MNCLSKNQLKNLAAYRLQKRCDEEGVFVVEGVKLCHEALLSDFAIRIVCGTAEYMQSNIDGLDRCGEAYMVTDEQLERLSLMRTPNKVWMLVERKKENSKSKIQNSELVLALDGLQDPGNMGTILRIADWFGIRHVVCGTGTVSCYNPKVVQSTMGAIFRTHVDYCDLAQWLGEKNNKGIDTYGAMLDGSDLYKTTLRRPAVLVIGNEGQGISPTVARNIKHRITIPNIGGTCESLNAATATAILCSEFYR